MMEMMLMIMKPQQTKVIRNLKFVVSGGDYLALSTVKTIRSCSPDTIIYNVGGPTETTLWNIYHEISEEDIASEVLPYGNPIDNTRYYILNEKLEEVPLGVIGKMYCAGIGVTYGYENNPKETAEKYITYPKTGERIYCTEEKIVYK